MRGKHCGRTRLHRQMDVIAKHGVGVDGIHDCLHEIARMRGGEAHAPDAGDLARRGQQRAKSQPAGEGSR